VDPNNCVQRQSRPGGSLGRRLNRAILYLIMITYMPAILILAAGMLYGAWRCTAYLWIQSHAHHVIGVRAFLFMLGVDLVVLFAVLLLLFGLLPLFFRTLEKPEGGKLLRPQQHPRLAALIERIAKRLGTAPPEAVLLTPFDNAFIGDLDFRDENGKLVRNHRSLFLGAGIVIHTNVAEFTTILCHELAHAATGDTRMCKLTTRFFRSLATQFCVYADDRGGQPDSDRGWLSIAMYWFLKGYFYLFAYFYCKDDRQRETVADRIAAEICGSQNTRDMLMRIHLIGYLPRLSVQELWREYSENHCDVSNLYEEHRRRWNSLPKKERERAENEMFMEEPSPWSSHPRLADRIRALADVEAKELAAPQSATALFTGWDAIEAEITRELIAIGRAFHDRHLKELELRSRFAR
jgi:Zn-dependent protease with chaperone function